MVFVCKENNVSIGGPKLKEKAEVFTKSLWYENFIASNGYLCKLKKRNDSAFLKLWSKSVSVSNEVCNEWKTKLDILLKYYEPYNAFNVDKTPMLYKCLPLKTLMFKN